MANQATTRTFDVEKSVEDILDTIDRDREREIISRRFGLFDRKETLEQIGELLGITRERVRQLEKSVVAKLKASTDTLPHISKLEASFVATLHDMGEVARVSSLSAVLTTQNSRTDQS